MRCFMNKKIGIIGQFPPPLHGLSKALETLYNSYLGTEFDLSKFDISNNAKFIKRIFEIFKSNLDVYYLTISQSKFGNIRDLIILKIIQMKRKKVIIHLHGGAFRNTYDRKFGNIQKKLNNQILNRVDIAIVLGDSLKFNFKGIIDDKKVVVVKNCVDNEYVLNDETFEEKISLFEHKNKINILYLSNFIEDKGYKDVLKLAKYTKDMGDSRYRYLFAGKFFDATDKEYFFKYIEDNDLENFVEYKGAVYNNEKKELLKASDYFILLSKNEGQPISVIEAASNGLRIITTNYPGIKDILNDEDIILCDKDRISVEEIYDMLISEYINRKELIYLAIENRKDIIKNFSEEKYIREFEIIFNSI